VSDFLRRAHLWANSSNTTLVKASKITFSGSCASRAVQVTPETGQTGTARITVSISDGASAGSKTTSFTFTLTVAASSMKTGSLVVAETGVETDEELDSPTVEPVPESSCASVPFPPGALTWLLAAVLGARRRDHRNQAIPAHGTTSKPASTG
jgi:hypothetical protein